MMLNFVCFSGMIFSLLLSFNVYLCMHIQNLKRRKSYIRSRNIYFFFCIECPYLKFAIQKSYNHNVYNRSVKEGMCIGMFLITKPFHILFLFSILLLCGYFFHIYKKEAYSTIKEWYIWFLLTVVLVIMLSVHIVLTYVYMNSVDIVYIVCGFIGSSILFTLLLMIKNKL